MQYAKLLQISKEICVTRTRVQRSDEHVFANQIRSWLSFCGSYHHSVAVKANPFQEVVRCIYAVPISFPRLWTE